MIACDICKLLHEGSLFVLTDGEFDDTALPNGNKRKTDDPGACDGAHACGCNGDAEADSNQLQNGKPMRSLLDHAWKKPVC